MRIRSQPSCKRKSANTCQPLNYLIFHLAPDRAGAPSPLMQPHQRRQTLFARHAHPLPHCGARAPARQVNLPEGEVPAHRHAHRPQPLHFPRQLRLPAQLLQFPGQLRFSKSESFCHAFPLPLVALFSTDCGMSTENQRTFPHSASTPAKLTMPRTPSVRNHRFPLKRCRAARGLPPEFHERPEPP